MTWTQEYLGLDQKAASLLPASACGWLTLSGGFGRVPFPHDPVAGGLGVLKSQLIVRIAERIPHLSQRDVEHIVDAILQEVVAALSRGDRVELRGFGAFSVRTRAARTGRNLRTGEQVTVPKKYVPFFRPGKDIRERVKRGT